MFLIFYLSLAPLALFRARGRVRFVPPLSFEEVPNLPVERLRAVEGVVFQLMRRGVPDKEDVAQDDCLQRLQLPVVEVCVEEEVGGEVVDEQALTGSGFSGSGRVG